MTLELAGMRSVLDARAESFSVRTVEGHLYRACGELGTSDRAELAVLLQLFADFTRELVQAWTRGHVDDLATEVLGAGDNRLRQRVPTAHLPEPSYG